MNSRKARRSTLEALVSGGKLSSDGADWLTLALDPFHDYQKQPAGYPDADCSNTVVECFQYAENITAPGAVPWDLHVFNLPLISRSPNGYETCRQMKQPADCIYVDEADATGMQAQIVSWVAATSGQPLFPQGNSVFAPAGAAFGHVVAGSDLESRGQPSRVIGLAFELINTTAELYKQGAALCYRMPQRVGETVVRNKSNGATVLRNYPFRTIQPLPETASVAALLKGTQQWDASLGAYVVCTQSGVENPLSVQDKTPKGFLDPMLIWTVDSYATRFEVRNGATNVPPSVTATEAETASRFINYNSSGVFMTGLSPQTTFRLRVKVYLEVAPSPRVELAVLATPSACYDPMAFEIYSKALTTLPPAVPVGFNAKGDWWDMVLGIIGTLALPVLRGVPVLGSFVDPLQKMVNNVSSYGPPQVKKRRKRNNRQGAKPQTEAAKA